jgi:hypothetical protein
VEEVRAIDSGIGEVNPRQVLRLTYEEFTAEPVRTIERVADFAGLADDAEWRRDIERIQFKNRNDSWKQGLPPEVVTTIEEVQAGELSKRGYA